MEKEGLNWNVGVEGMAVGECDKGLNNVKKFSNMCVCVPNNIKTEN